MDVSEQCGYSIEEQVKLFNNIKALFVNKPIILVANKIDIIKLEDLKPEKKVCAGDLFRANFCQVLLTCFCF